MNITKIKKILDYFNIPIENQQKVSNFMYDFIHFKRVMDKEIGSIISVSNTNNLIVKKSICTTNKNTKQLNINKKEVRNRIKSEIGEDFYIFPLELFQRYDINELIMNEFIEKMLYYKLYSVKDFLKFYKNNILELDILDKFHYFIKMGLPNDTHFLTSWIEEFERNLISNMNIRNKNIVVCKGKVTTEGKSEYEPNNMTKEFNIFQMMELQRKSFMLYLTNEDFPEFMEEDIQKDFENKLRFYIFIEKGNKKNCYLLFSPGSFFTRDFIKNYLNPTHSSSKFFQFFVNDVLDKKLKKFDNIIFMGHSRGSQISQMLGYYISIHNPILINKIYIIGTVSTAWLLNPNDFNQRLNGHFILLGYFELNFMGLLYDKNSFEKKILPIYFDQFMFYYVPEFKHPKIFFITKSDESYQEDINKLQGKIDNIEFIYNCRRMAFQISDYNINYIRKVINVFNQYLSLFRANKSYTEKRIWRNNRSNSNYFTLRLIRINDCKEPIDLRYKSIYTKCYHIWYPFYYNSLISLFT